MQGRSSLYLLCIPTSSIRSTLNAMCQGTTKVQTLSSICQCCEHTQHCSIRVSGAGDERSGYKVSAGEMTTNARKVRAYIYMACRIWLAIEAIYRLCV